MNIKMIPILPKEPFGSLPKAFAAMNKGVTETAAEGVRFMSEYPSKAQGAYRRTGTLRRSWFFKVKSGNKKIEGAIASNSNIAGYNTDVQGEKQEALFAKIGWRTILDLDKIIRNEFPKRMHNILAKVF